MWSKVGLSILAISASVASASACAMSAPQHGASRPCRVVGGEKLPKDFADPAALCTAMEQAIAAKAPRARYSVEVRVLSRSALTVNAEVGGKKVAEQHFSVMDRNLNATSVKRFADVVADEIAKVAAA